MPCPFCESLNLVVAPVGDKWGVFCDECSSPDAELEEPEHEKTN